jgi:UDP-N-acetylglucosamine 2-epimerase (non-hydrolysing)
MKITIVVGARPNFIKISPIINAIIKANKEGYYLDYRLVHTGQHYDSKMSESFFSDLNIPQPDINLKCHGGSQAEQAASIMVAFEKELQKNPAGLVIVVGDVTSTMACTIVARKLNTKVAHVEAGIRSFDLTMPEEINRMVIDSIANYFFTTSEFANQNLKATGVDEKNIFFVGNVMIDTLLKHRPGFRKPQIYDILNLSKGDYFTLTLHRPANVDSPSKLRKILDSVIEFSERKPVLFPVHPRTLNVLKTNPDTVKYVNGLINVELEKGAHFSFKNLFLIEPLGYLEFNYLVENSMAVLTDSGGITEETTILGVPCITLRTSTERPETVTRGTNILVGDDMDLLEKSFKTIFKKQWKTGQTPELWDGMTADRIVNSIISIYELKKDPHSL